VHVCSFSKYIYFVASTSVVELGFMGLTYKYKDVDLLLDFGKGEFGHVFFMG